MRIVVRLSVALTALAAMVLLPSEALGQDRGAERPDLPDIAPREYEIRGQLEISFPSLRRQPLIGFNPPPQLPEIPADRIPYVEDYKQASADLPASPLSPPSPPTLTGLTTYVPARIEVDASAGRYFSREIRGRVGLPIGSTELLTARLDYAGLDAYRPFDDEAPHNLFGGAIGVATHRNTVSAGAEVSGFLDTYSLYGAMVAGGTFPVISQPTRDGQGVNSAGWIRASAPSGFDVRLRLEYGTSAFRTDVLGETVEEGPHHRSSQRLAVDGGAEFPAGLARILVSGRVSRSALDESERANGSSVGYDAGAAIRFPMGPRLQLTAGARLLGLTTDADAGLIALAAPEDQQAIAPDVRLEAYLAHGAMLYLHNRPALEENDLPTLFQMNPFLVSEPVVAPTMRWLELEGGGRFFLGPVQVGLRGGYRDYPNYLYFEHVDVDASDGYSRGFSAARYDEATIVYGGGDVSVVIARGLLATVGVTGRKGRLADDVIIPYFGSVVGDAMLSFAFNESRGLVQLRGSYESSRFRDREESRQIGDFFDLDLLGSYYVTPALKVLLAIDNISAGYLERFDRYPLPSFVVRAGLGIRW